jgi:hypothetical protein
MEISRSGRRGTGVVVLPLVTASVITVTGTPADAPTCCWQAFRSTFPLRQLRKFSQGLVHQTVMTQPEAEHD